MNAPPRTVSLNVHGARNLAGLATDGAAKPVGQTTAAKSASGRSVAVALVAGAIGLGLLALVPRKSAPTP